MSNLLFYFLILALLTASIFIYFKIADRFNIIDKPNERSSHTRVTLRGGGIIFPIGIALYFLFFGYGYPLFFLGLCLIAFISFCDDVSSVPSKYRIVVHFVAMLLMFADSGFLELPWFYFLIALVVATGTINAYNFMDGINGITGGYSLVVVGSLWYVNNFGVWFVDNDFLYVTALALMVFNFFNFRKRARCFAGDVGAVSIAFVVLFLLGRLVVASNNFGYLAFLMVYGVDSVLTIVYRLRIGENIFQPHRRHLYQLLSNECKMAHPLVATIYMVAQIVVSLLFVLYPSWQGFVALALVTGAIWFVVRALLCKFGKTVIKKI